jgi:signal peptidase I
MDIDFSLVLFCLVLGCGAIWLFDSLLLRQHRLAAISDYQSGRGKKADDDAEAAAELARLAREPLPVEYAKSFFPVLLIVFLLRSFLVEPFQIPTGSMIPTLEVGDFILVNKYAYGVRLPIIGTKIMDVDEPDRGEVMVFIPPHVDQYYIKRVVGLPGDTVRYENKDLYINGEMVAREYVQPVTVDTSVGELTGTLYSERLGEVEHPAQFIDAVPANRSRTTWIIPPGHYFMMGDNRDNSADSRVWGPVPETNIVGKAIAVWMHKDPGLNLPNFSRNQWIK